jgi:uncharacterized phiE125 gp8 family phage protein
MRWLDAEVTSPPTGTVVSLDEAKAHLRVDSSDEDDLIQVLIETAQTQAENITGLRLLPQTVVRRAWELEDLWFRLPEAPVSAVDGITYLDFSGDRQTLDPSLYVTALSGLRPQVSRAFLKVWPIHICQLGSVEVTLSCGFADGECPAPIRQAILLYVGDLYANREAVVIDASRVTMIENPTAERLLANYRRAYV